ncbi:MAG: DUF2267 domain-containing protein [Robiginitalea sp.]|jgi:uncharacterized protein (DUF2267 family)
MALNFNQYAQEGHTFIKAYAEHMGFGNDHDKAGRVLTATLHALRDIIPFEESLQLIAQFPMFLKAIYVNGWTSRRKPPRMKHMEEFIELVRKHDGVAAVNDFGYEEDLAEKYIQITFMFLRKNVSLGELEDIRDSLPKDLKYMIYSNLMF